MDCWFLNFEQSDHTQLKFHGQGRNCGQNIFATLIEFSSLQMLEVLLGRRLKTNFNNYIIGDKEHITRKVIKERKSINHWGVPLFRFRTAPITFYRQRKSNTRRMKPKNRIWE